MTLSTSGGLFCLSASCACTAIWFDGGVISRFLYTTFLLIRADTPTAPSSYKFYITHNFRSALAPNEALMSCHYKPRHCGRLGQAIQGLLWLISIAQIVSPWLPLGFNVKAYNQIWAQGIQLCSVFFSVWVIDNDLKSIVKYSKCSKTNREWDVSERYS